MALSPHIIFSSEPHHLLTKCISLLSYVPSALPQNTAFERRNMSDYFTTPPPAPLRAWPRGRSVNIHLRNVKIRPSTLS